MNPSLPALEFGPEGARSVSHGCVLVGVARGLRGARVVAVPDGVGAAAAGRHAEAACDGGRERLNSDSEFDWEKCQDSERSAKKRRVFVHRIP